MQEFGNEKASSAYLATLLDPWFKLVPEVWMRHFDGHSLRMDYAAIPRGDFHCPWFGIEVKHHYDGYTDFSEALRQAVDYRSSRVVDARVKVHANERPPFVFVWPDVRDATGSYEEWAAGSERSHGKLKVGLIRERNDWDGQPIVELWLSGSIFWRSSQGIRGGNGFGRSQKVGAK